MKRILVISVVLALALSLLLPSVAMAKAPQDFSTTGLIQGISLTEVGVNAFPLGNSGKWKVVDRLIYIEFPDSGEFQGLAILTYSGVFDISTQAGNLTGNLVCGDKSVFVNARVSPLAFPEGFYPTLEISGHWNGLEGIKANGNFLAQVYFIPDDQGHIVGVTGSFEMNGKYPGVK